jgi:hypothetical protein
MSPLLSLKEKVMRMFEVFVRMYILLHRQGDRSPEVVKLMARADKVLVKHGIDPEELVRDFQ